MLFDFYACLLEKFHQYQNKSTNIPFASNENNKLTITQARSKTFRLMQRFIVYNLFLISLSAHIIVEQTETNTQNHIKSPEQSVFLSGSELFVYPRTSTNYKGTTNLTENPRLVEREPKIRFKVSPTRIRFSTNNLSANHLRLLENDQSLSKNPVSPPDTVISFSHLKKSKLAKQMAPAYEMWPNLKDNLNLVVLKRKKAKTTKELHCRQVAEPKLNSLNSTEINTSSGNLRNLLPKPVPHLLNSASSRTTVRVRSVNNGDSNIKQNTSESGDADVEDTDESSSELDESEPESSKEADFDINMNSAANSRSNMKLRTNFRLNDDFEPLASFESRDAKETMVYPPGDSERLYSDALLVYVKDFNDFIE